MPTSKEDVAHLMRRAGFGATLQEVNSLSSLSRSALVNRLVDVSAPETPRPQGIDLEATEKTWELHDPLRMWWLELMAASKTPLVEKMTLFWHGHFTSSIEKVEVKPMWEQNGIFRSMGMGPLQQLTQTVFKHAAMLEYLDNASSSKDNLNENFAREQMELFLLGVDRYTQADVVALARAWTGHSTDDDGRTYKWKPDWHDDKPKTFMGVTYNWDGPACVDAMFKSSKTRQLIVNLIAREIWTFFAYENPEQTVMNALTSSLLKSNLNIRELLRTMFNRDEFYSKKAKDGHVRSPVEFVLAARKYTGIPFSVSKPIEGQSDDDTMGQALFGPPNVAGWPGNKAWITTSAWGARGWHARTLAGAEGYKSLLADTINMSVDAAVRKTLMQFGVQTVQGPTYTAMVNAVAEARKHDPDEARKTLIVMALMSTEFQVA